VFDDIDRQGIADIVNLGDSLSGPMDPEGTADLLMARDLPTVSGNHDRALVDRPFDTMPLWEAWTHPRLNEAHLTLGRLASGDAVMERGVPVPCDPERR
jgi:hypothetical protein